MKRAIGTLMVARPAPSSTWVYRSITIDQPASDLTDFPLLFSGTYSYLATVANGGGVQNSNGYDITFYSDSSLTTLLDFERVFWDSSTGEVEFWVRIPTLTSASQKVIYISYGNPSITTDQANPTAVWNSDLVSVWHMKNASSPVTDSTSNALDIVENGTVTFGATGKIGKATSYNNNVANFLNITSAAFQLTTAISIEGWVKFNTTGNHAIIDKTIGGNTNTQWQLFGEGDASTSRIKFRLTKGGSSQTISSNTLWVNGTWYHFFATWDGSTMLLYIDSVQQTQTLAVASPIDSGAGETVIGRLGNNVYPMDGTLDELRVYNDDQSVDWIAASYSNQNDPANFYAIGSEVPV